MERAEQVDNTIDLIRKEIIMEDIKDLPVRLTPKDIYNYYNRDEHVIGWNKVYELSRKLGHRYQEGRKIYINKADFVKFVYGNV